MADKIVKLKIGKINPIATDGYVKIWKHTKEKDGDYVYWTLYDDPNVHKSKIYYYTYNTPYFVVTSPFARTRKLKLTDFIINDKDLLKLTWYAGWQ